MKVYVLVLGSYSDKRIAGIFVDKNKAEKVADAIRKWSSYGDEVNPIMEFDTADDLYDVSDPIFEEKKGGFGSYRVYVYGDGFADVDEEPGIFNPSVIWDGYSYEVCVLAKDEDTAKKIAFDKVALVKRLGISRARFSDLLDENLLVKRKETLVSEMNTINSTITIAKKAVLEPNETDTLIILLEQLRKKLFEKYKQDWMDYQSRRLVKFTIDHKIAEYKYRMGVEEAK